MRRMASRCPAPAGRLLAQAAALSRSARAHWDATIPSASFLSRPEGRSCTNAAAACGSLLTQELIMLDITPRWVLTSEICCIQLNAPAGSLLTHSAATDCRD